MEAMGIFEHDKTFTQPIMWITTLFMAAFHVGAIAALFFFTWKGLALAVVLWWVAGSLGIGMGYHRLLTHRGYKTPKWLEYFLTVCGTLAFEGGPIAWVATHRLHHQNTDIEGDPHSPRDGGLWAHMGWIMTGQGHAQQLRRASALCARSAQRQISRLDQQVALGSHGRPGSGDFCHRWMVLPALGLFFPYRLWSALHLAGELSNAHVGIATLSHRRYVDQQLLGGHAYVRRGLA